MIADFSLTNKIEHPFAIKWIISEADLEKASSSADKLKTATFEATDIPGVNYYLALDPNGSKSKRHGKVWFFFNVDIGEDEEEKVVEANYIVKIESAKIVKEKSLTFNETRGAGYPICSMKDLFDDDKNLILDGKLTLEISGVLSVEKSEKEKATAAAKRGKNKGGKEAKGDNNGSNKENNENEIKESKVEKMLWNREWDKDFVLIVDGKEIKVHKCILGSCSTVFDLLFTNAAKKKENGNKVRINDFSYKIVETGIKLCYGKSLATVSSFEDALLLLQFFDTFKMEKPKANLEALIAKKISPSNAVLLASTSIQLECSVLKKACLEYLADCLSKKIAIINIRELDPEFAKDLVDESLYYTLKTL